MMRGKEVIIAATYSISEVVKFVKNLLDSEQVRYREQESLDNNIHLFAVDDGSRFIIEVSSDVRGVKITFNIEHPIEIYYFRGMPFVATFPMSEQDISKLSKIINKIRSEYYGMD